MTCLSSHHLHHIAKKIPLENLVASRTRTGLSNNSGGAAEGSGRVDLNSNASTQDNCAC